MSMPAALSDGVSGFNQVYGRHGPMLTADVGVPALAVAAARATTGFAGPGVVS